MQSNIVSWFVHVLQTSDVTIPHSKLQSTVVLVSGFKKIYSSDEITNVIPKHVMDNVFDVSMYCYVCM